MADNLDELQNQQRQASLRKTIKDLRQALGLKRRLNKLLAVSDKEWEQAERKDDARLASPDK